MDGFEAREGVGLWGSGPGDAVLGCLTKAWLDKALVECSPEDIDSLVEGGGSPEGWVYMVERR